MKTQLAPTAPAGALLLRLTLVGDWAIHWWFKVGYRGMPATESFFSSVGLPAWLAVQSRHSDRIRNPRPPRRHADGG
jgi:uncharacterized membrane protein YphA (DoxX/SURF4 family)